MRRSLFNLPRRLASFQVPSAKGNVFRMSSSSGESTASAASLSSDPLFQSLFKGNEELNRLKQLFEKYGYPIRFAGGPVRDLLQGKVPNDLDFATTATPDEMKELFEKENVRTINALGEKHGTITARINDKVNYEITTLRIDKVSAGHKFYQIYRNFVRSFPFSTDTGQCLFPKKIFLNMRTCEKYRGKNTPT